MRYYHNIKSGSVYRTEETKFSNGEPTLSLERWNWDMENWNGHIHSHEDTRKLLAEGVKIIEITEDKAKQLIKQR